MRYLFICLLALSVVSCGAEDEEKVKTEVIEVGEGPLVLRPGPYRVTMEDATVQTWVYISSGHMQFWYENELVLMPMNGPVINSVKPLHLDTELVANDIFMGKLWDGASEESATYISNIEGCWGD